MRCGAKNRNHFCKQKRFHLRGPPPCGLVRSTAISLALRAWFGGRFRLGSFRRVCGFWVRKMGPYLVQFLGLVFLGFLRKYNRTWKKPVPKLGPFLVAKIAPRSGPRNQKIADLRLVFVGRPAGACSHELASRAPKLRGALIVKSFSCVF